MEKQKTLYEELKKYFGFDTFKGNQKAIIESVLSGKDTFVLMPTGGGNYHFATYRTDEKSGGCHAEF